MADTAGSQSALSAARPAVPGALWLPGAGSTGVSAQATGSGWIEGLVKTSSGTAIRNVEVDAYDMTRNLVGSSTTNADGMFSLFDLPNVKVFIVTKNAANYVDEYYDNVPVPGHFDAMRATHIRPGGAADTDRNLNVALSDGPRAFRARCTNASGTGLADIEIAIYDLEGNEFVTMDVHGGGGQLFRQRSASRGLSRCSLQNDDGLRG